MEVSKSRKRKSGVEDGDDQPNKKTKTDSVFLLTRLERREMELAAANRLPIKSKMGQNTSIKCPMDREKSNFTMTNPHLAPIYPHRGGVGHPIDRCIINMTRPHTHVSIYVRK